MRSVRKRTLALTMALIMTAGALAPAASAVTIPPACDETYYATLDYYGGIQEGSVVKSYRLNGAGSVTDYGSYDRVVNLTDSLTPTVDGNTVTFELGEGVPEKFYFEGKTQKPFEELPWNISVSYRLNGAPALAEDLAGRTGLVEIALDVTGNPRASEYSRTNLVLTAAAAFNDDEITSLEAPGAEVQMVGNLRAVLFMVLPGEEQHFVIRVGSDNFSFSGLVLLAVPATLQQLEQVHDLKEAKEKSEDSLDAIGDSMDAILTAMEGMNSSLYAAAGGLDQLNNARGIVSGGKGDAYGKADLAISDLDALADALGSLDAYAATASQAITDLNGTLNGLNGAVQELRPELEDARRTIAAIQKDTEALTGLLEDVEGYNRRATVIAGNLTDELGDMELGMNGLDYSLRRLRDALNNTRGISRMEPISIGGISDPAQIEAAVNEVMAGHQQYVAAGLPALGITFEEAVILSSEQFAAFQPGYVQAVVTEQVAKAMPEAIARYCAENGIPDFSALPEEQQKAIAEGVEAEVVKQVTAAVGEQAKTAEGMRAAIAAFREQDPAGKTVAEKAANAAKLYDTVSGMGQEGLTEQLKTMELVNTQVIPVVNGKIGEINRLISGLTSPTASVVNDLAELCDAMDDTGMADDLASLARLCRDLLKTMKEHEGEGADLLAHVDELGDLAAQAAGTAGNLLVRIDALNGTLNTYEPELQNAVTDVRTLSGSAQTTLHDLAASLTAIEDLLQTAGSQLDEGTRNTLNGVSASLRKAAVGMNEIDTIRSAKDTLKTLVDDEWDSHTGEVDGLLNINAGAPPVSMTDPRNPTPGSIQYVMRTQEIKAEEAQTETAERETPPATTFWGRVAALFRGLWSDLKKVFHVG